tara:strand:- start:31 stop:876 length:846 start_codon:yes stop_codon:yes gene_type:complete
MKLNNFYIFIYKKISYFYNFIFGRKISQKINNLIFSLALGAKGYKNYGSFDQTGEKNFIKTISSSLKLTLDIGANTGKYTQLILDETKSNVISFEPLKEAFKDLKNIEKVYPERLKTFNYAVGDKNEYLDLNTSNSKSEKASFSKDTDKLTFYEQENSIKINTEVITLDSFFKNNPKLIDEKELDFIKIDTEGFELEVIIGAKNLIEKKKPKFIQLEFNWHQLFKKQTMYEFSKYLEDYYLYQLLPFGKKLIRVDPIRPETNIFHLSNFVYIRKDISSKFE